MIQKDARNEQSSTGEYISDAAAHWQIEPFIPVPPSDLFEYLRERLEDPRHRECWQAVSDAIQRWLHDHSYEQHQLLQAAYAGLDPDRDTSLLMQREASESVADAADVARLMREALAEADYAELSRDQLEAALDVASLWGVPIKVDLEIFEHLGVFARGDVVGVREIRRWQNLFRQELVEVEIYRRLVVMFQVRPGIVIDGEGQSDRLYLRMFKNIPKADVDMLLPGTKIQFGWFDHTKILLPSLGGISMSLWKLVRLVLLVAVITTGKLLVLLGLLGATVGYVVRSVMSYFQTRKNYELNLTRSLYFQKLDSNFGVIFRILDEARQQSYREALLSYYALLTCDEPVGRRRLKRRCERMVRELLDIEIDFDVDDALRVLSQLGLVRAAEGDKWIAAELSDQCTRTT
jgi:hypothetical protein